MTDENRTVYTLKTPVQLGSGTTVTELAFRRPKGKDLRKIPMENSLNTLFVLGRVLSGQPDIVFDELEVEDVQGVVEILSGFMPGGGGTGQTP